MIYHITKLLAGKVAVRMHGIPMFFIHMVAGLNFGMAFAKLNGQFRVAFNVEMGGIGYTGKQEEFFADFEH